MGKFIEEFYYGNIDPQARNTVSRFAEGVKGIREKKYYIMLDDFERRVVVNCLNEMWNNLIANGKYADAVDEWN